MWFFQVLRGREDFLAGKYPALHPQRGVSSISDDVSVSYFLSLLKRFFPRGTSFPPLSPRVESCSSRLYSNTTSAKEAVPGRRARSPLSHL